MEKWRAKTNKLDFDHRYNIYFIFYLYNIYILILNSFMYLQFTRYVFMCLECLEIDDRCMIGCICFYMHMTYDLYNDISIAHVCHMRTLEMSARLS